MATSTPQQLALAANLMACLCQKDMTDMHLLGADDIKVPAFRIVLACSSDVFRKMLVGHFEESTSKVVKLGYSSEVLRAVVEFCITDNVMQFEGRSDIGAARGYVQLIACAHFLNMPRLACKARTLTNTLVIKHKSLACAVFDEASLFGEPTESVKLLALVVVRRRTVGSLLSKPGILCVRQETLSELISDDKMNCEEITLFRALKEWASAEVEDGYFDLDPEADRVVTAKTLIATHIQLLSIRPTDLVGTVRKSGLVDETKIVEVLEAQALLAEKEYGVAFSKRRKEVTPIYIVSGAGKDAINGVYEKDGELKGYPKYTTTCTWKGEDRTFCIYRWGKKAQWYISVVSKNKSIGSDADDDFYFGSSQESVPFDGWKVKKLGSDPCPVCQEV